MTPDQRGDTCALIAAARSAPRADRYQQVVHFVKGLLAAGITDPELVWVRLEAAGIREHAWRGAAAWSTPSPSVQVVSRRGTRAAFLERHGMRELRR